MGEVRVRIGIGARVRGRGYERREWEKNSDIKIQSEKR